MKMHRKSTHKRNKAKKTLRRAKKRTHRRRHHTRPSHGRKLRGGYWLWPSETDNEYSGKSVLSKMNPRNWFGSNEPMPPTPSDNTTGKLEYSNSNNVHDDDNKPTFPTGAPKEYAPPPPVQPPCITGHGLSIFPLTSYSICE